MCASGTKFEERRLISRKEFLESAEVNHGNICSHIVTVDETRSVL